jgi:hypothetical protein
MGVARLGDRDERSALNRSRPPKEHGVACPRPGGEPDFAPSSETPGGYVGQAALQDGSSIGC